MMDSSKRTFIKKGGAALLATVSLSPLIAIADDYKDGISAFITASFSRESGEETVKDQLVISKKQSDMLQDLDGPKRAEFLSDLIMRWLRKRYPDFPWPKMGSDVSEVLTEQTLKQLESNGIDGGDKPFPSKIKIKLKFKFKPPGDWSITLIIEF